MEDSEVLTTTQAAKLLGLSNSLICKFIDGALLKGWRVPGRGGHRRVKRSDVLEFAEKHKLPIHTEERV